MGTKGGRFHIHWRVRSRAPRDLKHCVPLQEYAQSKHYSGQFIRYLIRTNKVVGYKIRGRWYIDPRSTEMPDDI
jgi:hypothetical protein